MENKIGLMDSVLPRPKRSQSETVGFVLIVVIVMVLFLVFLYFMLHNSNKPMSTSADISNLLSATMQYTSDCAVDFAPQYKTGQELVKECYKNPGETCLDGRNICKALNDSMKKLISDVLDVGENTPIKAFILKITYKIPKTTTPNDNFFKLNQGSFNNCTEKYSGSHQIFSGNGYIDVVLEVCKSRNKLT